MPTVYFHLYVLVPKLLNQRRYVLYVLTTVGLLFAYSAINYSLLKSIPEQFLSPGLKIYIDNLNYTYDIFEGLFALIITYALKYAWQALSTKNRLLQLQKDNLMLELNALKAQIHPHFLFNTLNNIYSLSLRNSDKVPEMILKLSDMMRYVLYETNSGTVPLQREIEFLTNYIDLEKLRHNESASIRFSLDGSPED